MGQYRYMGSMYAVKLGGTMQINGRDVTIPDQVVNRGEAVELDDDYAAWLIEHSYGFVTADEGDAPAPTDTGGAENVNAETGAPVMAAGETTGEGVSGEPAAPS